MKQVTIFSALRELYEQLSPRRRRALVPLLVLMLAGAVAEVVTIGALLPFLSVIADPQDPEVAVLVAPLLDFLDAGEPGSAIYVLAGLFSSAVLLAAILRLLLLWAGNSFVNGVSYELAVRLYTDVLHEPYILHTQRNSSQGIAAITKVQLVTYNILTPLMQAAIALVIACFIISGLIFIDPRVALVAGTGFSAIYLSMTALTRSRLKRNSSVIARAQDHRVKTLQEGLGGIRDVLIDQSQPVFIESYERAEAGFRDARTMNTFLAGAPRYVVEAAGMILIALVAVAAAARSGGLVEAIPMLGALALGAQRLLPLIQQVYSGWSQTIGNRQVLFDLVSLFRSPRPDAVRPDNALQFNTSISLRNVSFSYLESRDLTLSDVNLEIPKGARVGIVGKTGSGKSTLMDLILGLLEPDQGEIYIDGVALTAANRAAWQRSIAHVPQFIYLADLSIAENIAFGVRPNEIDMDRVHRVAEQAELAAVVAALPEGYDTRIGERGIQLSGGQCQRLGIARALYKQASVLVLDEATSALDNKTESAVMEAIGRLDRSLTILIIAHRLSTLDKCDMIVRLEAGRVKAVDQLSTTCGAEKQRNTFT